MSTKELSLSFLTSITLGNEALNKKEPKIKYSRKTSDSKLTGKKEKANDSPRKKTPRIDIRRKNNQTEADFLLGISFGDEINEDIKENELRRSGLLNKSYKKHSFEDKQPSPIKLKRDTHSTPIIKNKESFQKTMKEKVISNSLIIFRAKSNCPFIISSLNVYCKEKKTTPIQPAEKSKKGISYGHLLTIQNHYDPYFLDNESLKPEKLKTVVKLSSYCGSIIPFSGEKEAKQEENDAFVDRHNWLTSDITLSKIRSAKRKLVEVALLNDIEPVCVAFAFVYLEKLILRNSVFKNNYKYVVPSCLILAVKFYGRRDQLFSSFMKDLEMKFNTTTKEILQNEFNVYKTLNFSLIVHQHEVAPHLIKIQRDHEFNVK